MTQVEISGDYRNVYFMKRATEFSTPQSPNDNTAPW